SSLRSTVATSRAPWKSTARRSDMTAAASNPQLSAADLARDYGYCARHWTRLAAAGKIPGASQPIDGGRWWFDPAQFKRWWDAGKREIAAWPGYTAEAKPI